MTQFECLSGDLSTAGNWQTQFVDSTNSAVEAGSWLAGCSSSLLDSAGTESAAAAFRTYVRSLMRATPAVKRELRGLLSSEISSAEEPAALVGILLSEVGQSSVPGRLDQAIDVIAATHIDYGSFLRYLAVPPGVAPRRPIDGMSEDSLYVIARAAGKSKGQLARGLLLELSKFAAPGAKEGAAEGLAEVGAPWARATLERLSRDDPAPFIRELARDLLNG